MIYSTLYLWGMLKKKVIMSSDKQHVIQALGDWEENKEFQARLGYNSETTTQTPSTNQKTQVYETSIGYAEAGGSQVGDQPELS